MTLTSEQLWQIQCSLATRLAMLQGQTIQIDGTMQKRHTDQVIQHTKEAFQVVKEEYEKVTP